jgi:type IV pilus assembly protein PilN
MIRINLLPVREARRKAGARQQLVILAGSLLATLGVVGVFHLSLISDVSAAQERLAEIDEQIKRYEPQIKQVEEYKKRKEQIRAKLDVIEGLEASRSGPVRLLDELATLIPERLWLTRMTVARSEIMLEGLSLDNEIIASFLTALTDSPYFKRVELDTSVLQSVSNLKVNSFKIRAGLTRLRKGPKPSGGETATRTIRTSDATG